MAEAQYPIGYAVVSFAKQETEDRMLSCVRSLISLCVTMSFHTPRAVLL
jgi:hypothetical protein